MASPISVQGIGSNKHSTNKYVILLIYLAGKNDNEDTVDALITREAHIVDGLKVKMLIRMNIMRLKQMDIITSKKSAYIDSCKTTIAISTQL